MDGYREIEHSSGCEMAWLVEDVGHFLADDEPAAASVGRQAIMRGAEEVNGLLRSAFAAHEVVASELRLTGRRSGGRRTVFAETPTPVALLLLCLRLCDHGDEVSLLQHTAAKGTTTRSGVWPFGMAEAEQITRPPVNDDVSLPDL
jgi:hypothetical protein